MKLYFDHRTYDAVSVYITVNDQYLGRVRARKERVTSVELPPDAERIKLSFSEIFDPSDELEKVEYDNISFGYEREKETASGVLEKKGWQYPYDLEIDLTKYQGDMVFYPANLNVADSDDILFYKGRRVSDCGWVEMKLLKRKQEFKVKDYRKEKMLAAGLILLGASAFLLCNMYLYFVNPAMAEKILGESGGTLHIFGSVGIPVPTEKWLVMSMIGGLVAMIGDLLWLRSLIKYDGMMREEKMKDTYLFTEHGEIKEA